MQRALVIGFTILYAFLTTGIALNLHTCKGELEKVAFANFSSDSCCHDSSPCPITPQEQENCCEDQPVFLRFNPGQPLVLTRALDQVKDFIGSADFAHNNEVQLTPSDPHMPPDEIIWHRTIPLWLIYCSMTIYS